MKMLIPAYVYTATLLRDGAEKSTLFVKGRVERARQRDDRGIALSAEMVGLIAVVVAIALVLIQADIGKWILNMIDEQLQKLKGAKPAEGGG
ncbi:hypothetical protein SAMN04489712_105202 [Thermomonospora echinospora]|uniref:Uncharacterized protein n=2 Tax=Thermomonospora echinospora TaxID=1992 RepID=A0A1H6A5S1_9ACTN|nr:hypothetical protein SAMN04489712_105202 [Thermomonospora echinospora]